LGIFPNQQAPNQQQFRNNDGGGGGGGGGRGNSNPSNPFRNYENRNYCFTHGCHVEDDHTSQTCKMPGRNHDFTATTPYTGGSTRGNHKTIMPSQCGRQPNRTGQREPTANYLARKAAGFPAGGMRGAAAAMQPQQGNFQQGMFAPQQQQGNLLFQQPFAGFMTQFGANGGGNGGNNSMFQGNMGRNF